MEKLIFVGSIIAVVILILVPFTGVVGYQTTKSSIAKASPLFNVRTNRAIDKESKDLTCKYVGKGNTLPFPERDDRTVLTQKIVDRISKMDDKTFNRFIAYIINYAQKDKGFNGVKPDKIREALYLLRNSDKPIPIFDAERTYGDYTCFCTFGHGFKGFIGCMLLTLSFIINWKIGFIFWCFHIGVTGASNSICVECPITLR